MLNEPSEADKNKLVAGTYRTEMSVDNDGYIVCTGTFLPVWQNVSFPFKYPIEVKSGDSVRITVKTTDGSAYGSWGDLALFAEDNTTVLQILNKNLNFNNGVNQTATATTDGVATKFNLKARANAFKVSEGYDSAKLEVHIYVNGEEKL